MEITTYDRVEISTNSQAIAEEKHQPSGEEPRGDLLDRGWKRPTILKGFFFFGAVLSQVVAAGVGRLARVETHAQARLQ
ncbi:hypothetical protein ASPBRDRAFT_47690 [Aspergillus brasiliensis CBS 101740]|uniref:Uncharacterized protein n=1 Tax=Aspergillus brasiliensis (strain CBS 101740 / IMI 381727 / IBT 21946) TaxID=767769 RepID=A0A1L9U7I2_ASPBC|nr:hypothetical protein ASPBRDRAFT_47690 [Aspergillus brasiliensis CBS 101740]